MSFIPGRFYLLRSDDAHFITTRGRWVIVLCRAKSPPPTAQELKELFPYGGIEFTFTGDDQDDPWSFRDLFVTSRCSVLRSIVFDKRNPDDLVVALDRILESGPWEIVERLRTLAPELLDDIVRNARRVGIYGEEEEEYVDAHYSGEEEEEVDDEDE